MIVAAPTMIFGRTGILTLALLAASCTDPTLENQATRVANEPEVFLDYKLTLPVKFKTQQVAGIDSKVEEWRSADATVSTDFGSHSSPPKCHIGNKTCSVSPERIGGVASMVGQSTHGPAERQSEPKPFKVHVHVPVDERQRLRLNLFARCDNRPACDEALGYFRRVRFLRQERPSPMRRSGVVPPVPPHPETR